MILSISFCLLSSFAFSNDNECNLYLFKTKTASLNLEGCEPKGVLYRIGNFLKGQYVVDMRNLKSGDKDLDQDIFDYFYFKNRYSTIDLYAYEIGKSKIKVWLKINGVVKIIKADVLKSSRNSLEIKFYLSLSDFRMHRKQPWSLFEDMIKIKLRLKRNAP